MRIGRSKSQVIHWSDLCTGEKDLPRFLALIILVGLGVAFQYTSIQAGEAATTDVLEGIEVQHDESKHTTRYEPAQDRWSPYEYQFHPLIVRARDGQRLFHLHASTQNERKMRIKALDIKVDGVSHMHELGRRDVETESSGCRVTEAIVLEGENDLIKDIAGAKDVKITFIGSRSKKSYELAPYDLSVFERMVALYDLDSFPEKSGEDLEEATGVEPGEGVTNPRLIRPSKVDPEFPRIAQAKRKTGSVTLHAVVRKDGSAEVIEVMKSTTPYCGFEPAAVAAVEQWRYKPGFKDGEAVDFHFTVIIDFTWQ